MICVLDKGQYSSAHCMQIKANTPQLISCGAILISHLIACRTTLSPPYWMQGNNDLLVGYRTTFAGSLHVDQGHYSSAHFLWSNTHQSPHCMQDNTLTTLLHVGQQGNNDLLVGYCMQIKAILLSLFHVEQYSSITSLHVGQHSSPHGPVWRTTYTAAVAVCRKPEPAYALRIMVDLGVLSDILRPFHLSSPQRCRLLFLLSTRALFGRTSVA